MEGIYTSGGHPFLEDVPLMEFIYLAFTRTPGGVTVAIQVFVVVSVGRYYFPLFVDIPSNIMIVWRFYLLLRHSI